MTGNLRDKSEGFCCDLHIHTFRGGDITSVDCNTISTKQDYCNCTLNVQNIRVFIYIYINLASRNRSLCVQLCRHLILPDMKIVHKALAAAHKAYCWEGTIETS